MSYLYQAANEGALSTGSDLAATDNRWPLRTTVWLVLAFGSFAWVAIIFGCITLL